MAFPNLSALAVRERSVTLFFLILCMIGGLYAFISMGRAEDPAFTVRVMVVSVQWPGATPTELQDQVVDRLEKQIQQVPNLDNIDTTIRPGQANMVVQFHDYTPSGELQALFDDVRKRMDDERPHLPAGVIGPQVNDDFSDVFFSLISLTAPELPMGELTREAEAIRDRLNRVPGVQKALVMGERPERVFLEFDNSELANLGISAPAIFQALQQHNRLGPAGQLQTAGPRVHLRVNTDLSGLDELRALPLRVGEQVFRLGDIAQVRAGYQDPPNYLVRAQQEDALLLGVVMSKGENGLDLGARMERFVAQEKERLPLGINLTVLTNQAEAIASAVNLFQVKFLVALIVVVGVSILALGLQAGLIVGIAIPITLAITFMIMTAMGISLDRITLGALIIALGLLVDDAIIAIEMMIVKMEQGWERVHAAAHAWNVTAAPMLFGTLVTIAGFVPIGFAQSGVGEYAGNIFWVLAISLLASWLVAVVFTPLMGVYMLPTLKTAPGEHADPYQTRTYKRLRGVISRCVDYRKSIVAATFVLLVAAVIGLAGPVQKQFFPASDRPEVLVSIYHPQGSAIAAADQTSREIEAFLAEQEDVRNVSAYIGAGAPRFFISANPEQPDPAFAKIVAVADNKEARDRVMAALQQRVTDGDFPQARVRVWRLLYGPPVVWPLSLRVLGESEEQLRGIAKQVRQVMAEHPHTRESHLEHRERVPVMRLNMDPERLVRMGLTPAEVADQLQFQLQGVVIDRLRQGIRTVDLVARAAPQEELELAVLEVRNHQGRKIPVAQLGEMQISHEDPVLRRYNRQSMIAVNASLQQGAQPNTVTDEVWQALGPLRSELPAGYRIEIGGAMEQSTKADASIQKLQPLMVALMLIFIMLQMRTFSGTFIVVATAPLGIIGAVVALLLFNQPFGFVALLGLIGLAGILMRNTLILTQQVNDNFRDGMAPREAVVEAAVQRSRPVMLTALAAIMAFIPLTQDGFWGPLAYVLIGGVALGTLITLLFVPALYALWFRIRGA
ncbi:MAG: efflux RND transporter permease subunit [Halomonadaceae bacterium]|nr:MAG: efflux RND transporter permease subunit [Halomonadaceae bacterium]